MVKRGFDVLTGFEVAPNIVGFFRGVLIAGALAAIGFAIQELPNVDWKDLAWAAPVAVGGLRWLEGFLDELKQPSGDPRIPPTMDASDAPARSRSLLPRRKRKPKAD